MALHEDVIREELKKVVDPELFVNIIDLGLVYRIDITPVGEQPQSADEASQRETSVSVASGDAASSGEPPAPCHDGQEKHHVRIEMTMTSPLCPAGPQLIANCKHVLSQLPEVASVEVKIVLDPPWTPDRMTDAARDQLGIF